MPHSLLRRMEHIAEEVPERAADRAIRVVLDLLRERPSVQAATGLGPDVGCGARDGAQVGDMIQSSAGQGRRPGSSSQERARSRTYGTES